MPAELAEQGQALGYTALAITDHDSLSGAMEFAQACAAVGVQPITGVELSIAGPRPEDAPRHLRCSPRTSSATPVCADSSPSPIGGPAPGCQA